MAQTVKHLPAMWKTQVRSLGWEDPLKKEMATHTSTPAWKIKWTEECGRQATVHGVVKSWTRLQSWCQRTPVAAYFGSMKASSM